MRATAEPRKDTTMFDLVGRLDHHRNYFLVNSRTYVGVRTWPPAPRAVTTLGEDML